MSTRSFGRGGRRVLVPKVLFTAILLGGGVVVGGVAMFMPPTSLDELDLALVGSLHEAAKEELAEEGLNLSQEEIEALVMADPAAAFATAFDQGDELFEITFNALDGVGANVRVG